MAKFKKLAILCLSLVMAASLSVAVGCDDDESSSTPPINTEDTNTGSSDTGSSDEGGDSDYVDSISVQVGMNRGILVPAGKIVPLQMSPMLGFEMGKNYKFTWTDANLKLSVNGTEYSTEMEAVVMFTPMATVELSTVDATETYAMLMIKEVIEGTALSVGEQSVEVSADDAAMGVTCLFTPAESGTYVISTADENASIIYEMGWNNGVIATTEENDVQFILTTSDTLILHVGTLNEQADTIEFSITKIDVNAQPLTVGENSFVANETDDPATASRTFTAVNAGTYIFETGDAMTYSVNGATAESFKTVTLTLEENDVVTFVYTPGEDDWQEGMAQGSLTIKNSVAVGESTVALTAGEFEFWFTPEVAGKYKFTVSEGATVWAYSFDAWDYVELESGVVDVEDSVEMKIISDTLTAVEVSVVADNNLYVGDNNYASGTYEITFTAPESETYEFIYETSSVLVQVKEGEEYVALPNNQLVATADTVYNFKVTNIDDIATITIRKYVAPVEAELVLEEQVEAAITVGGRAVYSATVTPGTYIISWNQDDINTVIYNGEEYYNNSEITFVQNSMAGANVSIEVWNTTEEDLLFKLLVGAKTLSVGYNGVEIDHNTMFDRSLGYSVFYIDLVAEAGTYNVSSMNGFVTVWSVAINKVGQKLPNEELTTITVDESGRVTLAIVADPAALGSVEYGIDEEGFTYDSIEIVDPNAVEEF